MFISVYVYIYFSLYIYIYIWQILDHVNVITLFINWIVVCSRLGFQFFHQHPPSKPILSTSIPKPQHPVTSLPTAPFHSHVVSQHQSLRNSSPRLCCMSRLVDSLVSWRVMRKWSWHSSIWVRFEPRKKPDRPEHGMQSCSRMEIGFGLPRK